MTAESVHYQIENEVLVQTLGDTVVLFHPGTEQLLTLNPSGTRIWKLLSEEKDAARLIERLSEEYSDPDAMIQPQVLEFLSQLESQKLIRRGN